ncbi:MAG: ATP-binding protein [Bacillota bacterium]
MESMKIPAEKLRLEYKPEDTTIESPVKKDGNSESIVGQDRALHALEFGLNIKSPGFNIYAAGMPGTGKETAVKNYVDQIAKEAPTPSDLCYVNNFKSPYQPHNLVLPAGQGAVLEKDVGSLVENARQEIPRAFESDDYIAQRENLANQYNEKKQKMFNDLNQKASESSFIIQSTPSGFVLLPQKDGKPLQDQDLNALSDKEREEIFEKKRKLEEELKSTLRETRNIDKKLAEEIKELDRKAALFAVEHLFQDLLEKYKGFPKVINFLQEMQEDMLDNINMFRQQEQQQQQQPLPFPIPGDQEARFKKYQVNVIVDNSDLKGAPVVLELNPTYNNIFGRIEKETQFGGLVTDFTMIRGGSLHKANGGFFVVKIDELLRNPFTWESLKRVIKSNELEIEEPGEKLGFVATKTLRPEPVKLDVKIVIIGTPIFYHLLYNLDLDFRELFKVKADFDTIMERNEENIKSYCSFANSFCQKENLINLDNNAMAKIVEHGSRLAEDQNKLSTRFSEIADIVREACFYAHSNSEDYVRDEHINQAIESKVYRSNLVQEKLQESMERNFLLIDTEEAKVGQINGLSVMQLGEYSFGKPTRITCSLGMGRGGIIDIEREAQLGGRLHSKGVMILSGYLSSMYAKEMPLTLSARLVFEQSYSEIEGDSASSTELYTLLSSLANVPLKQNLAVTGSVNQRGEVQAIGGVNEKIEGFYELCKTRGLTGDQGVIIPRSNEPNLMLKEEVVEAVRRGDFYVYAVNTVVEGIELLTGTRAGRRKEDGTFEEDSINFKVEQALRSYAQRMKNFGKTSEEDKDLNKQEEE